MLWPKALFQRDKQPGARHMACDVGFLASPRRWRERKHARHPGKLRPARDSRTPREGVALAARGGCAPDAIGERSTGAGFRFVGPALKFSVASSADSIPPRKGFQLKERAAS